MNNVTDLQPVKTMNYWMDTLEALGSRFAERAERHDRDGRFVADNYADLREHRFFSAGIPAELGGGGASFAQLSEIIRVIARHCGSTALAFSMHTHPVGTNVFKHLRGDETATASLRKIAEKELVIATTGANDWLSSSGEARRVEGGYRVSCHKRFVSGVPGAQLFVTSAAFKGPDGDEVLHFALPIRTEGIRLEDTWDALGMRGTGSTDVILEDVFVADEAIVARRPAGVWHALWSVIIPTALPLITSAYVGLAETAADWAVKAASHRQAELAGPVGEMLNELTVARITLADMVRLNDNHGFTPSLELADAILARKAIAAGAVKKTVELAAELVGGPGFFRGHPVERIVRDVRAMHYHPLPSRRQQVFCGRIALGFDPVA